MPKTPRVRGKDLVAALGRAGFVVVRVKGSHYVLSHADGRRTVVPVHAREVIGPGLLLSILADCEVTVDDLRRVL
jgi:predicted RNA binding protein YcfA (HicA-like mRNA interferase family)